MEIWRGAGIFYLLRLSMERGQNAKAKKKERAEWKFREGQVVNLLWLAGERADWKFREGQVVNQLRLRGEGGRLDIPPLCYVQYRRGGRGCSHCQQGRQELPSSPNALVTVASI
jgi:hypothetical protein